MLLKALGALAASILALILTLLGAAAVYGPVRAFLALSPHPLSRVFAIPLYFSLLLLWLWVFALPMALLPYSRGRNFVRNRFFSVAKLLALATVSSAMGALSYALLSLADLPQAAPLLLGLMCTAMTASSACRSVFSGLLLSILPKPLINALDSLASPKVICHDGRALLVYRGFLRYVVAGALVVSSCVSAEELQRGVKHLLRSVYEARIPLGYIALRDCEVGAYFLTWCRSLLRPDLRRACERLEVLEKLVSTSLPKSSIAYADETALEKIACLDKKGRGAGISYLVIDGQQLYGALRLCRATDHIPDNVVVEAELGLSAQTCYALALHPSRSAVSRLSGGSVDDYVFRASVYVGVCAPNRESLSVAVKTFEALLSSTSFFDRSRARVRGFSLLKALRGWLLFSSRSWRINLEEAVPLIQVPVKPAPGLPHTPKLDLSYPTQPRSDALVLGEVLRYGRSLGVWAYLPTKALPLHVAVFGATGSGKSNFVKHLLKQLLQDHGMPFLVFDPHGEYASMAELLSVEVVDPVEDDVSINILEAPRGIPLDLHIDYVTRSLHALFGSWGPNLDRLARSSLHELYRSCRNPTISDWIYVAKKVGEQGGLRTRLALDSLLSRLERMSLGVCGRIFDREHTTLDVAELLSKPMVIDLSQLDLESASLFASTTMVFIIEARRLGVVGSRDVHVTVVEEAHGFAPRIRRAPDTQEEVVTSPATAMLKELRKYGEGLILVDQRPSAVTQDALANCNTLVVFRLFENLDKAMAVSALGLNPTKGRGARLANYISTLNVGHAIARTPDAPQPFEIKIPLVEETITPRKRRRKQSTRLLARIADEVDPRDKAWQIVSRLSPRESQVVTKLFDTASIRVKELGNKQLLQKLQTLGLVKTYRSNGDTYLRLTRLGQNTAKIILSRRS